MVIRTVKMTNKFMSKSPTTLEPDTMLQATKATSNIKQTTKNEKKVDKSAVMSSWTIIVYS